PLPKAKTDEEIKKENEINSKDEEYDRYLKNTGSCEGLILEGKNKKFFLKKITPPYAKFNDAYMNDNYSNYLNDIGVKNMSNTLNMYINGPFEKAKIVYTETQNAIFNCAILHTRLKIGESILKYLKGSKKGEIVKKIEQQNKNTKTQIKAKCTELLNDTTASYKQILLDNVTWHYCFYRYYLDYLNSFSRNNINSFLKKVKDKNQKSTNIFTSTNQETVENVMGYLNKQKNMISDEINHVRTTYEQSLIAYQEFENTYGIHVMLLFIYDDYLQTRENIKKLLNPIGQLIYKIPKAQKQ
ncbi:hypothetical protein KAZ01_03720, partial [Candidatus Gracilibacteria bacterium]|nr:hypothetical protein [Candidatus Gracilibacteria bacterium]